MLINEFLKIIENAFPSETAMADDRLGLQVQSGNDELSRILLTLEVTDDTINEAVSKHCNSIITFHPLIFNPLTSLNESDRVGRLVSSLIRNSISLISIHTNFDAFREGTSKIFADLLGLKTLDFLVPNSERPGFGMGVIAEPFGALTENDLLENIHSVCNSPLRFSPGKTGESLKKIAIVCGSGMSFFNAALKSEADAFITADISYHNFHRAKAVMLLVDPGHYEMEQFVPMAMYKFLSGTLDKNQYESITIAKAYTNPVSYFPCTEIYNKKQKTYLINLINK